MVIVISLDGFPAYALDDAKLPIPTLRRLIREGVTARMGIINPTVTWPNHTTMVTGVRADEHGLLVNGSLVPTGAWPPIKVDPMVDKVKMVHAPTVYDAAHKAGLTTAQIDWVAINNAPTITWPFNEWATPAGRGGAGNDPQGCDRRRRRGRLHQVEHPVPRPDLDQGGGTSDSRAPAQPDAAALPVARFGHTINSAPRAWPPTSAIAFLDSCVEKVVAAVHEIGMDDRTTFLVVADHGFKAYTKEIRPAIALAEAGLTGKVHVDTGRRHGDDLRRPGPGGRSPAQGGEGAAKGWRASARSSGGMALPRSDFPRRRRIRR